MRKRSKNVFLGLVDSDAVDMVQNSGGAARMSECFPCVRAEL